MTKRYNIGLTTRTDEWVGFIVEANDAAHAEQLAREQAKELGIAMRPGSLRQRRDDRPEANNSYFDQSYKLLATVTA